MGFMSFMLNLPTLPKIPIRRATRKFASRSQDEAKLWTANERWGYDDSGKQKSFSLTFLNIFGRRHENGIWINRV
jgi:hypothetical protein